MSFVLTDESYSMVLYCRKNVHQVMIKAEKAAST
jgi:hypothetical protein